MHSINPKLKTISIYFIQWSLGLSYNDLQYSFIQIDSNNNHYAFNKSETINNKHIFHIVVIRFIL